MRKWLHPSGYSMISLFVIMGLLATLFALNTLDLLRLAMANLNYLLSYGVMALVDGGLLQSSMLFLRGTLSLCCYLGFKAIEHEIIARWFNR